ncbi:hypothetical protein SAY86_012336 [Trapa natans]|uniref:mannan endo-1,4-beta-mannosidase n=1 Tax=Trapa natans TaxID=22666 RepID=A0AAN7R945_TRANT|nr:hypothetical protein SAY86_012336 [Trapa natans]
MKMTIERPRLDLTRLSFLLILLTALPNGAVLLLAEGAGAGRDGFVATSGVHFMLDGSPFYGNGFNAYWLMFLGSDPAQRSKVSLAFEEATSHGLTIGRAWAFSDGGYSPLQYSPGSYNEQMFQGLDFAVSEARKYRVKLVLSLVNNYETLGGKKQYVEWARSQGRPIWSDDDFFTDPLVKTFYKNHIKTVLTRRNTVTGVVYKDDPTIMAWELMNEIRCPSDQSGRTVQAWITEMASYVKSIDGNHLLEAGLEGFYGPSSAQKQWSNPSFLVGTDFIQDNQIPGIDFATVHSYPDQWLTTSDYESQLSFLRDWVSTHIQDAQITLQKPILFAEFGKTSRESGYSPSQRDQFFSTVYSAIYTSASGGGVAAGSMFWQLLTEGMDSYRDGYEVVLSESPTTASLIKDQSEKLNKIRKMYARLRDLEIWRKANKKGTKI